MNTRAGATLPEIRGRVTVADDEGGAVGSIPATGAKQSEWETEEEYAHRMRIFLRDFDETRSKCEPRK